MLPIKRAALTPFAARQHPWRLALGVYIHSGRHVTPNESYGMYYSHCFTLGGRAVWLRDYLGDASPARILR
jgi:hypothetical protein